jgi:DNA-binding NarL/FixJ family response regulator
LVVAVLLTIFVGFSSWRGFRRAEKDAYRVAKSISVVTMTFSSEGQHLVERYNLGVNRYVRKPVDFEQFQKTVKTLGPYWLVVNESSADGSSTAMTRASN